MDRPNIVLLMSFEQDESTSNIGLNPGESQSVLWLSVAV